MTYKDQLNRKLQIKGKPKRILSLVPSQTELLVDLGLEDTIIGITKFCIHPEHLRKSKIIVGGTKQIRLDRIKALEPDIILCNKEENSREIITSLEGVAPVHISDIYNLEDCYQLIKMYGELFQVETKALNIISNIEKKRQEFREQSKHYMKQKVAYFIWKAPWMVAASHTFINFMLSEAGFYNSFKDEERYPEITLDHLKLRKADVIFLSSEPYPFKEKHKSELKSHFPDKTITIVDGELFSWYGSRLQQSFDYFKTLHV